MRRITIVFAGLLFVAACNTTASSVAFSRENFQAKNEAVLYLFRTRAFVGGGVKTYIFFDDKSVGLLPQLGYFPIHALAGRHKLRICTSSVLAWEECREFGVDLIPQQPAVFQVVMTLSPERVDIREQADMKKVEDLKNEGAYYDTALREFLPASANRVQLTTDALGGRPAAGAKALLKVAIPDFKDETGSNLYGWLSGSVPDAIDQSMRKDFEYKRQPAEAGANLVISGSYAMSGKDAIRIEAKIYYRDTDKILGTESVDSPLNAELFNATKTLSDRLVAKFHAMVKK